MATIESHKFIQKSTKNLFLSHFVFIFYGSDKGLIFELINQFKKNISITYHDPFSLVVLNALEIQKNISTFWNEINSTSLFSKKKIILIENLSTEKKVLDCLEEIIIKNICNHIIIIKSNEIKKNNTLRKIAEKFTSVLAISCYPDNKIHLMDLIEESLLIGQKSISKEAKQILLANLGGDRIASRNELQKLSSYCLEDILITEQHVKDIICDTHVLYIEEIINATIQGKIYNAIMLADFFLASKMPSHALLHGFLQKFQLLEKIHIIKECSNISFEKIIQKTEKNIIPMKRNILQESLRIWNKNIVRETLHKIDHRIHLARKKKYLEKNIIFQTILYIAQTACKK
ncbi:DNA polymerase III subunit delta [Candidatus Liberibacter asiaticus]|uniref:DNA polymerase III subunit delta n=1 Tax=Liberibacter asiaticus TaxID=34021 RepID=UPI0015EB358A|nr:DNA polymerase III subunit delta [Candidatus Liberibacter asiaticus]